MVRRRCLVMSVSSEFGGGFFGGGVVDEVFAGCEPTDAVATRVGRGNPGTVAKPEIRFRSELLRRGPLVRKDPMRQRGGASAPRRGSEFLEATRGSLRRGVPYDAWCQSFTTAWG